MSLPPDLPPPSVPPNPAITPETRIGDEARSSALVILQEGLALGYLSMDEWQSRSSQALTCKTAGEIDALVRDLPAEVRLAPWKQAMEEQTRAQAEVRRKRSWRTWAITSVILTGVYGISLLGNASLGPGERPASAFPWPLFVIVPWGLALWLRDRQRSR
jgi:hypothetical protein